MKVVRHAPQSIYEVVRAHMSKALEGYIMDATAQETAKKLAEYIQSMSEPTEDFEVHVEPTPDDPSQLLIRVRAPLLFFISLSDDQLKQLNYDGVLEDDVFWHIMTRKKELYRESKEEEEEEDWSPADVDGSIRGFRGVGTTIAGIRCSFEHSTTFRHDDPKMPEADRLYSRNGEDVVVPPAGTLELNQRKEGGWWMEHYEPEPDDK
jgi:hypothetical protein